MIRTTTHHFARDINASKMLAYRSFRERAISALKWYVDYLWTNQITWGDRTLDVSAGRYEIPSFISTVEVHCPIEGSARLHKCLSTQACGIVKAVLRKARGTPTKPVVSDQTSLELNSINTDIQSSVEFDFWVRLKCLGTEAIHIPLRHHKHSLKYARLGTRKNSYLLGPNYIDIRWEIPEPINKSRRRPVGADQGLRTVLTLSNGASTDQMPHPHGWTLEKIVGTLAAKRKGSRGFRRAQDLRENFINWSINQLDLHKYKTINLEDVRYLRYRRSTSRKLSHWTYTLIKRKIEQNCEAAGVQLNYNSSVYRSQRCSSCGLVKKSQRQGKAYICLCGFTADADVNAACNHAVNLPPIPRDFLNQRLNLKGFYWNTKGFKTLGRVPTVPAANKSI